MLMMIKAFLDPSIRLRGGAVVLATRGCGRPGWGREAPFAAGGDGFSGRCGGLARAEAALAADLAELAFDTGGWRNGWQWRGRGRCKDWRWKRQPPSAGGRATGSPATGCAVAELSHRGGGGGRRGSDPHRLGGAAADGSGGAGGRAGRGLAALLEATLGEEGRADPGLIEDVSVEMAALEGASAVTRAAR